MRPRNHGSPWKKQKPSIHHALYSYLVDARSEMNVEAISVTPTLKLQMFLIVSPMQSSSNRAQVVSFAFPLRVSPPKIYVEYAFTCPGWALLFLFLPMYLLRF